MQTGTEVPGKERLARIFREMPVVMTRKNGEIGKNVMAGFTESNRAVDRQGGSIANFPADNCGKISARTLNSTKQLEILICN